MKRILVYGDIHLSCKKYGAHKDYPSESLGYFRNITNVAESINADYIIGLGDLTYNRFSTLEYRIAVEEELMKQYRLCNGNRYELRGNHDVSTKGITEYQYYCKRGILKPAENLAIGNLNLSMVNSGESMSTDIIKPDSNKVNMVLMHDYFKFNSTRLPDYGQAIELDHFDKWYGVDYIVGGHIHNYEAFEGMIRDKKCSVMYLGCPSRPAYREGHMQDEGIYLIIEVDENITNLSSTGVEIKVYRFPLLPIEESFTLGVMEEEKEKILSKSVDISDIVEKLSTDKRVIGEPEDIIQAMDVDEEYKNKAIELLRKV